MNPALTVPQVAEILNCGQRIVRAMIADGRLDHFRIGRLVRIHPDVVAALMRGDVVQGPADAS